MCVFENSEFQYLDVGVSFRNELQHYFQKYCTQPYPILFRSPPEEARPRIRIEPFGGEDFDAPEEQVIAINTQLAEFLEAEFTYMPSWPFALQSALRAADVAKGAHVGVWAAIGEASYIEQLRELFGDQWQFSARPETCAARIACHRWGYYCPEAEELSLRPEPLIEDCRDVMLTNDHSPRCGAFGAFAVYDFARWLPLPFGAVLAGAHFPDKQVWDKFHCLDVTKRNRVREGLQVHWRRRGDEHSRRTGNLNELKRLFGLTGMHAAQSGQIAPACYVFRSAEPYGVRAIHERLLTFGVATECDEASSLLALPCHARLGNGQLEYMFAAIRGMINPCYTFVRPDPDKKA